MSKFQNYLKTFDITSTLTEEDIDKTLALLQIYGPAVRRTASRIGEMEEECYEGRRQSISDSCLVASSPISSSLCSLSEHSSRSIPSLRHRQRALPLHT